MGAAEAVLVWPDAVGGKLHAMVTRLDLPWPTSSADWYNSTAAERSAPWFLHPVGLPLRLSLPLARITREAVYATP